MQLGWLGKTSYTTAVERQQKPEVITLFKVTDGHWVWYQVKNHMQLPISD